MPIDFEGLLRWGQMGETAIAYWLRQQGYSVLPAYDIPLDTGKGPRFYAARSSGHNQLIAPDILAMCGTKFQWIEAKRKTRFSWRRVPFGRWQTGIDVRHYHDYLHVQEVTGIPLWILFLHMSSIPSADDVKWGCPTECPTGLFAGEITWLEKYKDHEDTYQAHGRDYAMVYWNYEDLLRFTKGKPLATLEEILAAQSAFEPVEEVEVKEVEMALDW